MANVPYPVGPGSAPTAFTHAEGGSVRHPPGLTWLWSQVVEVKTIGGTTQIGATALTAALTQAIDLNVAFPRNTFPANVQRGEAYIKREVDLAGTGITSLDIELGDTGVDNGLITTTDVFTGALATATYASTPAATQYAFQTEQAFVPLLTLTAVGANVDQLAAGGRFVVCIPFRPLYS